MKKLLVLASLSCLVPTAQGTELVQRSNAIPGKYIVVLHDDNPAEIRSLSAAAKAERRISVANQLAARHGGRTEHVYQHTINGFVAGMSERQARAMLRDPRVRFIEQDTVVSINQTVQGNATWGLDRIDQRNLPIDTRYGYFRSGRGVNAYIIDTGVLGTHAEFTGRMGAGFSAVSDNLGTTDCNGHGTHVAGTVGGSTWGVAKQVTLYPVRVLGCNGSGSNSGVIAGVDWVTANHVKPAVANMSLGGGASTALDEAVRRSINAGVTYAIAAGNENADACNGSPSRVTEGLVVGASTRADARASFSNFGSCLDIFAPGQDITSAWYTSNTATRTISGTSMAAPHVAGAAALLLEESPSATPDQIQQALIANSTANKISGPGARSANRLLYALNGGPIPPSDPAPVASFTTNCSGRTCSFDASGSTDNAPIANYAWNFGDGTTASGVSASKTYGSDGTFNVALTVTDSANQTASRTTAVTVTQPSSGAPCTNCTLYTGTIATEGQAALQPAQPFTLQAAGQLRGWLEGPRGSDFDLFLLRWNGTSWATVAQSTNAASSETITFNASAGQYQWRIVAYRRTGAYQFWMQRP